MSVELNLQTFLLDKNHKHYINGFSCYVESLDVYLKHNAIQDLNNGNGVTYLVIDGDMNEIVAYYTLSSDAIFIDNEMLSAVSINMFALTYKYQHNILYEDSEHNDKITVGDLVMWDVLNKIRDMSKNVMGIKYVSLHSLDNAVTFYKRNGFIKVPQEVLPSSYSTRQCVSMIMDLYPIVDNV